MEVAVNETGQYHSPAAVHDFRRRTDIGTGIFIIADPQNLITLYCHRLRPRSMRPTTQEQSTAKTVGQPPMREPSYSAPSAAAPVDGLTAGVRRPQLLRRKLQHELVWWIIFDSFPPALLSKLAR